MKKLTSLMLAVFLLIVCINVNPMHANALEKIGESKAIAIVFDNSGSMYETKGKANMAWCRATYAMEVFASMLNNGDTLLIYPMWPITADGNEYTMENPLKITNPAQSSVIRDIFTPNAKGTPIESIDSAISGLQGISADKKYVIVLTDGDTFYINNASIGASATIKELDKRIQNYAGEELTMMYLGIGEQTAMPSTPESDYFKKKQAVNSTDVLTALTEMCNQIFGRDSLPNVSKDAFDFDISMSKLIVFIQGENISDVKIKSKDGVVLKPVSQISTKYSEKGHGNKGEPNVPDTTLQGMIVTYEDCDIGKYTIDCSGKVADVEVYFEPDADLDFVFNDADGNPVNPDALYEGEYRVEFGMLDAKTGKLIFSDLLGTPEYRGYYSINGEKTPITHDGHSGYEPVTLKMDDEFDANLTVTYLSGYRITKNSTDFGWPFGGIKVAPRPAGNLKLEISGGEDVYSLQDLTKGKPYIAKVYHEGKQLTGEELKKVELTWNSDTSNANIKQEFADDHFNLWLDYKDTSNPADTVCGRCTVTIYASYREEGSDNAQAQKSLSYMIKDDVAPLRMSVYAPDSYITIKDLDDSRPIVVELTLKNKKITPAEFDAVKLTVDCGKIKHTVTPDKENSAYLIKLMATEDIGEGNYPISVTAEYTDHIGRVSPPVEGGVTITLSLIALWLKWVFWSFIILLIALIIWLWLRTPVLPKKIRIVNISVKVGNKNMSNLKAAVIYPQKGKRREVKIKGTGDLSDARWSAILVPAKDSYRYLPSKKRKAMAVNDSVKASGCVDKIEIGSESFARNKKDNKLLRISESVKDFTFPQGSITYSGLKDINGKPTKYTVTGDIKFE